MCNMVFFSIWVSSSILMVVIAVASTKRTWVNSVYVIMDRTCIPIQYPAYRIIYSQAQTMFPRLSP